MKKKKVYIALTFLVSLFVISFIVFTYFPSLYISKTHLKNIETQINTAIPGLQVTLNTDNAIIKHSSGYFHKTHAGVTLKNVTGNLDLTKSTGGIGKIKLGKYIPEDNITLLIPEITLELGVFNKFVSIKNLNDLHIQPVKNKKLFDLRINNLQAKNYNLYLNNIQKDKKKQKSKPNSKTFNIKVTDLTGQYKDKKLSISELTIDRNMSKKIYKYLLDRDDKNIVEMLKSGKEKYTFEFKANEAILKTNNLTLNNNNIELSIMFAPINNRYAFNTNFQGFNIEIKGKKEIYSVLNNIKNTELNIGIENITPELIESISKLFDKKDKSTSITAKLRNIMINIRHYQPKININCEFDQRLINATAKGALIFTGLSFVPTGTINVEINGIDKMEKELKEKDLITDKVQKNLDTLKKHAKTTIEVRSQMPFIFINDRAITDLFREIKINKTIQKQKQEAPTTPIK